MSKIYITSVGTKLMRRSKQGASMIEAVVSVAIIASSTLAITIGQQELINQQLLVQRQTDCRDWQKQWIDDAQRQLLRERTEPVMGTTKLPFGTGLQVTTSVVLDQPEDFRTVPLNDEQIALLNKLPVPLTTNNPTLFLVEPALGVVDQNSTMRGYQLSCRLPLPNGGFYDDNLITYLIDPGN